MIKSPVVLWSRLASELGGELGVDTSRDIETVTRRFEHEGQSFLSLTMPKFRRAFERALSAGYWDVHTCTSFSACKGLPRFLGGFLELVFEKSTGVILDEPNVPAIAYIRQLTGLYGSTLPSQGGDGFQVGCSDSAVVNAFEHYIETEEEVALHARSLTEHDLRLFRTALNVLFQDVLSKVDAEVGTGRSRPRHSNGATADRLKGNQKWTFPEWTDRLEEVFPYLENTVHSFGSVAHRLKRDGEGLEVHFRSPETEIPVRVIAVPKTCEKPRIISIEPSYMQYMQQAVGRALMREFVDSRKIRKVIQLDDRTHNQEAAQLGSVDGSLATLDLKDASDRLSWTLVQGGFKSWPWLLRAMDATRSRRADVPGAGVITLAKFASMGSALTFPIQTMVFMTIAFMGIARAHDTTVRAAFSAYAEQVRVFGDDIIIPVDAVPSVIELLELYGFKLNTDKSFWTGRFRESCGGDYYAGEDVSYVKVRRHLPYDRDDVNAIVSAVSLRNRFYTFGYWRTVSYLDEHLGRVLSLFPTVSSRCSLLGRVTHLQPEGLRMDPLLQTPVATGFEVEAKLPSNRIVGVDALARHFFEDDRDGGEDPLDYLQEDLPEAERFDRSGRPTRVTLKRRSRPF